MVPSPRKCPGVEGKVCERFLPAKDHNPHRLCVTCRGKSCIDNWCAEFHEWSEEHCRDVAAYAVKLSVQCEKKKEGKAKSWSSSFYGFSPTMPVPLSQLASTSGVILTSVSSTPVCTATFAVAGPAVLAVPSPLAVAIVEQPLKRETVMDSAERAKC